MDTANFDFAHFMAGLTAVIAAFASLAGGLSALGLTKKQTTKSAGDDCEKRVEQIIAAFERGAGIRNEAA